MADLNDLDILPAPPVRITIGGRQLEIDALRMRQWRPMTEALEGAWEDILSGDPLKTLGREEAVCNAIIVATEGEVDDVWLKSLYPAQVVRLFRVVMEQNRDFFFQAVIPEMRRLLAVFVAAAPPASPASSPGLSSGDTDTTTS